MSADPRALIPELRLRFRTSPAHPVHRVFDAVDGLLAENERLREALDAAMQYVPDKDRDWIYALAAPSTETDARCGSFGCVLPRGHNRGQADIPENHLTGADA
jgi:hypothetical protein